MSESVILEKKGSIAVIYMNRPEKRNAMSRELLHDLKGAIHEVNQDDLIRGMIFAGKGPIFSAGADLNEMRSFSAHEAEEFVRLAHTVMNSIESSSRVSLAAIQGAALGGGLELALSCDFRMAAVGSRLGLPEVKLGILPGFGGTQRLARLVGQARAMELIMIGDPVDTGEAKDMGLIHRTVREDGVVEESLQFLERLVADPWAGRKRARWLIKEGPSLPLLSGLEKEIHAFSECFSDPEGAREVRNFKRD